MQTRDDREVVHTSVSKIPICEAVDVSPVTAEKENEISQQRHCERLPDLAWVVLRTI